jgi:hypothetical protein
VTVRCLAILLLVLGVLPRANGADLRDPTRPPAAITPALQGGEHKLLPRVSAVFLSSRRRIAIFNAQPVQAGDSVGIYHIDEIDARGVRYSSSGHSGFAPLASPKEAAK